MAVSYRLLLDLTGCQEKHKYEKTFKSNKVCY